MEYEKICNEVIECNEKIRYVGIYDYGQLVDKIKPWLRELFDKRRD
ncbi:hypothetical protein [Nitrosopumilus sp.]|nr:hypothetical protein [Nitrosopumilus sp.]